MPRDEIHPNAYTGNAMMIAVETGPDNAGTWVKVRRNIVEDYRRAFGEDPPGKAVIAIMTDTDNTGKKAKAWYDDIYLMKWERYINNKSKVPWLFYWFKNMIAQPEFKLFSHTGSLQTADRSILSESRNV